MAVVAVVGVKCTPDVLCCLIKFLGPSHEMGYLPHVRPVYSAGILSQCIASGNKGPGIYGGLGNTSLLVP